MAHYFELEIELTVAAPFLCSAAGVSGWGVDISFRRDHKGGYVVPGSHVKGKLREAWVELAECSVLDIDVNRWLGRKAEKGDYSPHRGLMLFSDFIACTPDDGGGDGGAVSDGSRNADTGSPRTHRIRIDRGTGTADEGALITLETPFPSGRETVWRGCVSFPARDTDEGETVHGLVLTGLRWITALGAEKGVGYGRLLRVVSSVLREEESRVVEPTCEPASAPVPVEGPTAGSEDDPQVLGLEISAVDPLLVGGVKLKDNYMESGNILTGAIIKGALAQCIRRRLGLEREIPIGPREELHRAGLTLLPEYFERLRITHAFPSRHPTRRPVQYPLSLVKDKAGRLFDTALRDGPGTADDGCAPQFGVDWKNSGDVRKLYGWSDPPVMARTRTAIDGETRRAKDEMLYTFQYFYPETLRGGGAVRETVWLSRIVLPEGLSAEERRRLSWELRYVVGNWLKHMGKRDGRVHAAVSAESAPLSAVSGEVPVVDGLAVVTLQSDALMIDPWRLAGPGEDEVREAYEAFWNSVGGGRFELVRYFAAQKLLGGYLGKRFSIGDRYFPYLLTCAGSVFVLKAIDGAAGRMGAPAEGGVDGEGLTGRDLPASWQRNGLPAPKWAVEMYGATPDGRLYWKRCPFTPESGFGEVAVNLPCHRAK